MSLAVHSRSIVHGDLSGVCGVTLSYDFVDTLSRPVEYPN